ncbi:hypothetical protein RRG08_036207 [Elysia crispata]|uniref:Uncharacterized protein n=1 Tax=Elysia crispata TaxID=231223 RepID=A0AAE0XE70_9GAST|nr:hypothetical protein RRG08_036207 [Elysia crispata]
MLQATTYRPFRLHVVCGLYRTQWQTRIHQARLAGRVKGHETPLHDKHPIKLKNRRTTGVRLLSVSHALLKDKRKTKKSDGFEGGDQSFIFLSFQVHSIEWLRIGCGSKVFQVCPKAEYPDSQADHQNPVLAQTQTPGLIINLLDSPRPRQPDPDSQADHYPSGLAQTQTARLILNLPDAPRPRQPG